MSPSRKALILVAILGGFAAILLCGCARTVLAPSTQKASAAVGQAKAATQMAEAELKAQLRSLEQLTSGNARLRELARRIDYKTSLLPVEDAR